jgi:hypothetical protein
MKRFVLAGALVAAACGTATDDRPRTLEYITRAILAPSCATAECHSAFRAQVGDVFDTPEATRRTIVANHLVRYPDEIADPSSTLLVRVLTVGATSLLDPASGNVRMPYDAPLPDLDIELIAAWIADGIPGAQCTPNDVGLGCQVRNVTVMGQTRVVNEVVECPDGNVGRLIQTCGENQICDFYAGNGLCVAQ